MMKEAPIDGKSAESKADGPGFIARLEQPFSIHDEWLEDRAEDRGCRSSGRPSGLTRRARGSLSPMTGPSQRRALSWGDAGLA